MKIKTLISIHFSLVTLIMIVLGGVNGWIFNDFRNTLKQQQLLDQVVSRSFELNLITYDYLLNYHERAKKQWETDHKVLSGLLNSIEASGSEALELKKIIKNHEAMNTIFPLLSETEQSGSRGKLDIDWFKEYRERLSMQLILKSQVVLSSVAQLKSLYNRKMDRSYYILSTTILVTILCVLLLSVYYYLVIRRILVKPIVQIHQDAAIIGQGNLHHRVDIKSKNEIGKLSEILNKMSLNLSKITVSRDLLAKEIESRKEIEAKLNLSLAEKETLLQEVHHRVKNNMQVISSLLKLQSDKIKSKPAKDILMESRSRVYALSAVHELLYDSKNLAEIELKPYLQKITETLIQSYSFNPARISLTIDTEGIAVPIEFANPMGLIVNELMSNAIKYAFPNNGTGEVRISAKKIDGEMVMEFSDNGIGLPADVTLENPKTLGLHLVKNLSENQLDGSLEIDRQNGTRITIRFELNVS